MSEELSAGGFTFPENANMIISPYLMGRDETIFKDPLKFDPHRFEVETTMDKMNSFAYIPFSAGNFFLILMTNLSFLLFSFKVQETVLVNVLL